MATTKPSCYAWPTGQQQYSQKQSAAESVEKNMNAQTLDASRFYAALTQAGVLKEYEPMTPAKFHQLLNCQTITARKVYEAVPKEEAWTPSRIHSTMMRRGQGGSRDLRITTGCLQSLKESKLIAEPQHGEFIRVEVRARPVIEIMDLDIDHDPQLIEQTKTPWLDRLKVHLETQEPQQPEIEPMPALKDELTKLHLPKLTALDRLSKLSKRANDLAHMGQQLTQLAQQLASDIDAEAINIEDERAADNADTVKLKQLKALLGSI